MRSKELIYLVDYEILPTEFSDEGERIENLTPLYANRYTTSSSLQLKASNEGLRVKGKVEIWTFEYSGQEDIKVGKDIHTILSVEEKGDKTLLTYGERLAK